MSSARIKLSNLRRATRTPPPEVHQADAAWRRLRRGLDDRRAARSRWRLLLVPTATLVAAAAVAAVWYVRRAPDAGAEATIAAGRAFESRASAVALALPDGVHVDMEPHSRVAVEEVTPHQIRVGLGHGQALFDVEPHHQRRFIVDVGGVEVRVVGTRFRVARLADGDGDDDNARVEVSVERGIVEVASGGEVHRLRAGERYSAPITAPDEAAASADQTDEGRTDEPAPTPAAPHAPRAIAAPRGQAHPAAPREEARLLLEQAQSQWRAGQMTAAASSYEEILARYPNDARAGLAALELGRIQMDHLGDLTGAVVSLQRALRLAPAASVREDALARLVRATDRLGRHDDCTHARDSYLARYPSGIHAAAIAKACE
jgi:transmembrane sensor